MLTCPKCRNKIPAWKLLFLTNFNVITCPTCSTRLQIKNKRVSSLIGGIGGGVGGGIGGLLAMLWVQTKEVSYLILIATLLILIFFAAWLASIKLLKLKERTMHM